MKNLVAKFAADESGATAIEYGLIAALVGVAMIGGGTALGKNINDKFTNVGNSVKGA
jgi:pilus assembly protein Flp/PilA